MSVIPEDKRNGFASTIILNEMINKQRYFPVVYIKDELDNVKLENLFIKMISNGLIRIDVDKYVPTEKGRELLVNMTQKYTEFLSVFDLYSAVDLEKGEFGFTKFFEMEEDAFKRYINESQWDDVRIAVCQFKKIDPIEIVFLSFVNENRFDLNKTGWQFDLCEDLIWDEMVKIVDTAITVEQLGTEDVILDIIKQGSELMVELLKQENDIRAKEAKEAKENQTQEDIEDIPQYVEPVCVDYPCSYYDPYYNDPYYISPIWLVPLILL